MLITERIVAHGVRSLRADLAVVRGSRALAALEGASTVEVGHVDAVLPLALAHRARSELARRTSRSSARRRRRSRHRRTRHGGSASGEADRVFAPPS